MVSGFATTEWIIKVVHLEDVAVAKVLCQGKWGSGDGAVGGGGCTGAYNWGNEGDPGKGGGGNGSVPGELRRTNKVDMDDLTLENGLFRSFDEIVRRQVDPNWHTIGKKMRQLVSDLRMLRKLLDYLVRYDCVTYLQYLDTLRVSEGVKSLGCLRKQTTQYLSL